MFSNQFIELFQVYHFPLFKCRGGRLVPATTMTLYLKNFRLQNRKPFQDRTYSITIGSWWVNITYPWFPQRTRGAIIVINMRVAVQSCIFAFPWVAFWCVITLVSADDVSFVERATQGVHMLKFLVPLVAASLLQDPAVLGTIAIDGEIIVHWNRRYYEMERKIFFAILPLLLSILYISAGDNYKCNLKKKNSPSNKIARQHPH